MSRRAAVLVLCALATACSASSTPIPDASFDAGTDAGTDANLPDADLHDEPWEQFLDDLHDAMCARSIRCGSYVTRVASGNDDVGFPCTPHRPEYYAWIARAVRHGHIVLDPAGAEACLRGIAEESCVARSLDERPSDILFYECPGAFGPTSAAPVACEPPRPYAPRWIHQCGEDRVCVEHDACVATCELPPGLHEPCSVFPPGCASGLVCGGTCEEPAPAAMRVLDEPCTGWDCAAGLYCSRDGSCRAVRAEGASCEDVASEISEDSRWAACAPGAPFCVDSDGTGHRCSRSPLGVACSVWWDDPCVSISDLVCTPPPDQPDDFRGHCLPRRAIGESCRATHFCVGGATCVANVCTRVVLPDETCGGGALCPVSHVCIDARCVARPGVNEECDDVRTCMRGRCVEGACELVAPGATCGSSAECASGSCNLGPTAVCDDVYLLARDSECRVPGDPCEGGQVCRPSEMSEPRCQAECLPD